MAKRSLVPGRGWLGSDMKIASLLPFTHWERNFPKLGLRMNYQRARPLFNLSDKSYSEALSPSLALPQNQLGGSAQQAHEGGRAGMVIM